MKNSRWIGIAAALLLVGACYLPWAYFPDLHEAFTGFYSKQNWYGRPGKIFIFLCSVSAIFFLIPRIWAARVNIFVTALIMAFAVSKFVQFGGCYQGICPTRQTGIYLMMAAAFLMTMCAFAPNIKLKDKQD